MNSFAESLRLAEAASTIKELRAVLRDIADRALHANSAAAVNTIAEIAAAGAKGESDEG